MMAIFSYEITRARLHDLASLSEIELSAARLLTGWAPEPVLTESTDLEELRAARRSGHLWVALHDDAPVGFAHVKLLESGSAHLYEIDVHPAHARRGIGTRLILAVCRWAAETRYESVTLSTFRDVPWNAPFYARLGFSIVPRDEWSAALRAVINDETRRGIDPSLRVVMRRPTASPLDTPIAPHQHRPR